MERNRSRIFYQNTIMLLRAIGWLLIIATLIHCNQGKETKPGSPARPVQSFASIGEIPLPAGYKRLKLDKGSFGEWIRSIRLKADNHVRLYNGSLKADQSWHFAVLDMPVGNKDLQQCADAIFRLRAEYFFQSHDCTAIEFLSSSGVPLSFKDWLKGTRYRLAGNKISAYGNGNPASATRGQLEQFLQTVFSYCGTYTVNLESFPINAKNMEPGDVFVRAGSPGHAMLVSDVAENTEGDKIFMLAQSFMPAQDIHIVKNPLNKDINPWFDVKAYPYITPGWTFNQDELKRWEF